jgi:hypothetical protein
MMRAMAKTNPPPTPLGPLDYRGENVDGPISDRASRRKRFRFFGWFRLIYLVVMVGLLIFVMHYLLNYFSLIDQLSRPGGH